MAPIGLRRANGQSLRCTPLRPSAGRASLATFAKQKSSPPIVMARKPHAHCLRYHHPTIKYQFRHFAHESNSVRHPFLNLRQTRCVGVNEVGATVRSDAGKTMARPLSLYFSSRQFSRAQNKSRQTKFPSRRMKTWENDLLSHAIIRYGDDGLVTPGKVDMRKAQIFPHRNSSAVDAISCTQPTHSAITASITTFPKSSY